MAKVTKIQASQQAMEAVVTLDDGSQHVLAISDFNGFNAEVIADAKSGELADYLDSVPEMFRDTQEDIDESFSNGNDFEVIYEAA